MSKILILRFRSNNESKLWELASRSIQLSKQIGLRSIESLKPYFQDEDTDDLPELDGFRVSEWKG